MLLLTFLQPFSSKDSLIHAAAQMRYDFAALPDLDDSNIFMHPQDAWLAFRPSQDEGLWRVIYREQSRLSDDDIVARHEEKLQEILPGAPTKGQYQVVQVRPYKIHQRCVESMRKGRVILASDAAHLCCP